MICDKLVLLLCLLPFSFAMSNGWSNCSRTCGVGISHRLIPCQNTNCAGTQKEFRVCNPKECPNHQADFRSEQCQKYGKEMMPFINASNPCKLICTLPSQKLVEVGNVTDGTPCSSGGICIDGICVAVSCNRILGSEEKTDACGRCGSTNGICMQVPCMITNSTVNEYNVTLPVGSTKIKITRPLFCNISGLLPAKSVLKGQEFTIEGPLIEKITIKMNCHESSHAFKCRYHIPLYDISFIDGEHFNKHEHHWIKGNEFTPCSQTCGTGVQRSKIYCQNVQTEKIVDISLCDNLSTEHLDIHIRICNMPPCPYQWRVTNWSPCSKSCNEGHRSRNVTCVRVTNKLTYPVSKDSALCSEYKPVSLETCNHHRCYNHWHKGPWSDCSLSCGNGTRSRNITCINAYGMEVEANNCSLLPKYKNRENCVGQMCTYRWIASNWSNCSVDCGNGNQTRNLSCQHVKENIIVNDSLCPDSLKPPTIKQCEGSHCIGVWRVEKWGQCEAAKCHLKGLRYRNYYCVVNGSDGLYIDVTKCNKSNEPSWSEICYKTKGCKAHWVALPWGKCSVTCGNGIRTRGLVCKLGNKRVNTSECPVDKPSVFKTCEENVPCPPSCSPAAACNSIQKFYCDNPLLQPSIEQLCKFSCCKCDCRK